MIQITSLREDKCYKIIYIITIQFLLFSNISSFKSLLKYKIILSSFITLLTILKSNVKLYLYSLIMSPMLYFNNNLFP